MVVPNITITRTESENPISKSVWFEWRGVPQFAQLTWETNGGWLIVRENYTADFDEWLGENLNDYDSLETLFGAD
jgi:hypothetical protein